MKLGTEDRKKLIQAAVAVPLALIALIYLYMQVFGGSSPAPAPVAHPVVATVSTPGTRTAGGTTAKQVVRTASQLDPTLHPEVMAAAESLVYTGSGRNIFSASAAPVGGIEKPIASARPKKTGPVVPAVYVPPPPPPIDLKFFGTETSANGVRRAFLLHGEDVFIASAGDVVDRRYRVIQILANSVRIEDIPNSNTQTLQLVVN